jgi:sulfonate transport system ATP-binding protein
MNERHIGLNVIPGVTVEFFQVSCVSERNGSRLPVLEEVNLRIEPSELIAVLGPQGCGKSTLLRLVAGVELASSGAIVLDGGTTGTAPHPVVSRDSRLCASRTVIEQMAAAWHHRRGSGDAALRAEQILRSLGLQRFAGAYPRELTAGTAQRVSMAAALMNDSRMILLDDPFERLDPITRATIRNDLVALWRRHGFTALFATNDVDEALSVASRVVVLGARPTTVTFNLPLGRYFPRRPADPCRTQARRVLLNALDGVGTSRNIHPFAPRDKGPAARSCRLAQVARPGVEPATHYRAAAA